MRPLIDTHIFLWFFGGDLRLSALARSMNENPAYEKLLSIASVWEVAIKVSAKKLELALPVDVFFAEQLERNDITLLPITLAHTAQVATLPFHHRDPFDRLLAAQSLTENIPLLSADTVFDRYGITRHN